jgi:hypothetical protein
MPGARVRWRADEEEFEVVGHGALWFDDDTRIIGSTAVAANASLTELRHALDRYRATMYDGDFTLEVYDTAEELLREEPNVVPPRETEIAFAEPYTFLVLTLVVEPTIRFDRWELTAVLVPQLARHRAKVVELSHDDQPLATVARLTIEISTRGRTVADALAIGDDLYRLWVASLGGSLTPDTVADLLRAQRPELMLGQHETTWFEAKGAPYALGNDLAELELAKDVAALANRPEGGVLVLGLVARKRNGIDTVTKVLPIPITRLRATRYHQAIDRRIFPAPQDLVIETVETEPDHGLMFIQVPPQPDALVPFLVFGAIRDGKVLGNHFSLVRRRGEDTVATHAAVVHGLIVAGRAALAAAGRGLLSAGEDARRVGPPGGSDA